MSRSLLHRTLPCLALGSALLLPGCASIDLVTEEGRAERRADRMRSELIERQRERKAVLEAPSKEDLNVTEQLRLGDRLRDQGDVSKAALAYLRAHWAEQGSDEGTRRIAFLTLRKDPQKSLEIFQDLLARTPNDPLLLTGLAVAQIERGELDRARMALLEAHAAVEEAGPRSQIAELLGVVHDRLGRHEPAQAHYSAALEHRPSDARLLNNLGVSYLLDGQYDAAATQFEEALNLGAGDPALYNNLGLA